MDMKRITIEESSNRYSLFNLIHLQLLGEEMYSTRERDYQKHGSRNLRSEHSSRSASPDMARADNLGYEDSLDVAFEHNNKLRDKIQQRMRESENLIASTFGQKSNNELIRGERGFLRRMNWISRKIRTLVVYKIKDASLVRICRMETTILCTVETHKRSTTIEK